MSENLNFTKAAKVVALIGVLLGAISLLLGVIGFNGGSNSSSKPLWEIIPEVYFSVGLSCIVSGIIIGVLCEISQNISNMHISNLTNAPELTRKPGQMLGAKDPKTSDPAYKFIK